MNENEDRIWDVLIEDAMRESQAPEQPHEPGDYTRRLLTPVGPVGVDRGRSMRYTRPRWVTFAAWAVAVTLVCAILYAGAVLLPKLSEANRAGSSDPTAAGTNQTPRPLGNTPPAPAPQPDPEPQPEPKDNATPDTAPDNGGETEPQPDDSNEQPQPEPTPEPKPDDSVEQPKPEPKPVDTVKEPTPEPNPDDTVEQPKQPEPTAPESDNKLSINLLTEIDWRKPGLKMFDYSTDGEIWSHAQKMSHFAGNVWLRTRTGIDFEAGGVFLRLNGTMRVALDEDELSIELLDDELFVDSRGAGRDVSLSSGEHSLLLLSSATYFDRRPSGTDVSIYDGELRLGDEVITGPKFGKLEKRQRLMFSDLHRTMEDEIFLRGVKPRVVYRENFDADPQGRLREGVLQNGLISGSTVFWGYPENIQHESGLVIRLRVRFTAAEVATLTQFAVPRNDNFSVELEAERVKPGEWQILEVPLDEFLERTTHKQHPNESDSFMNVSIKTEGENALVELDWVELIRAVK